MHDPATVAKALRLLEEEGLGARRAASRLGLPVGTVRDWYRGKLPRHSRPHDSDSVDQNKQDAGLDRCDRCGHGRHGLETLPEPYVYLLGLYLGDGSISTHPRGVYKLRISLDKRYPQIVAECVEAMTTVMSRSKANRVLTQSNCWEVYSYSRSWPCVFPQHGPGRKHERRIWLAIGSSG